MFRAPEFVILVLAIVVVVVNILIVGEANGDLVNAVAFGSVLGAFLYRPIARALTPRTTNV